MLTVLSQPFFRQRQAVHVVTPTCSSHRERLTTAGPGLGYGLPFDSSFTGHKLPWGRRTWVYRKHKVEPVFPGSDQTLERAADLEFAFQAPPCTKRCAGEFELA
jgi:hypothetical protein